MFRNINWGCHNLETKLHVIYQYKIIPTENTSAEFKKNLVSNPQAITTNCMLISCDVSVSE